jgi:hypothetical protein
MKGFNRLLVAAALLVLLVNAVILAGVAWNRRAPSESVLTLSERELWLNPASLYLGSEESNGLSLLLQWAIIPAQWDSRMDLSIATGKWAAPVWLDQPKLAALGFDVSWKLDDPRTPYHYDRMLPRDVLLVLELDGPAYAEALKRMRENAAQAEAAAGRGPDQSLVLKAQRAREGAQREETSSTRLYVVDAGLDAGALRERYPDRSRYAIVRGSVRAQVTGPRRAQELRGRVIAVRCDDINVPPQWRPQLPKSPEPYNQPRQPFQVVVAVGRRFEPWILAASTPASAPPEGGH